MAVSKLYRSSRASDEGHALWEALLCIAVLAVVGALAIAASYGGAFLLAMALGWRYRSPD